MTASSIGRPSAASASWRSVRRTSADSSGGVLARPARVYRRSVPMSRLKAVAVRSGWEASRAMTPPELSALVLRTLRQDAEAALGRPIDEAVITVPAYFDELQRRATRDAAAIAGLK